MNDVERSLKAVMSYLRASELDIPYKFFAWYTIYSYMLNAESKSEALGVVDRIETNANKFFKGKTKYRKYRILQSYLSDALKNIRNYIKKSKGFDDILSYTADETIKIL